MSRGPSPISSLLMSATSLPLLNYTEQQKQNKNNNNWNKSNDVLKQIVILDWPVKKEWSKTVRRPQPIRSNLQFNII